MRHSAAFTVFAAASLISVGVLAESRVLVRVQTRDAASYVGELIESNDRAVKVFDIVLNAEVTVPADDVLRLTSPLSNDDAASAVGLPTLAAWQISKLPFEQATAGKIAKVTPTTVYTTLSNGTVAVGQKVSVFRRLEEIVDPDTGKVLAVERPRIAELQITDVADSYSKGKLVGRFETELKIGDEVEVPGPAERKVAVCPVFSEAGELTNVGAQLREDLTTLLVQKKVNVVERSALMEALKELTGQNTIFFEPKGAQRIGELTGASHVVVGKIIAIGKTGKAYLRLVDVRTGEIMYAASASVSLVNSRVIGEPSNSDSADGVPTSSSGRNSSSSNRIGGNVVELTENAPTNWLLKKVHRGIKIWWDREYQLATVPPEVAEGTLIVRSKGDEDEWLKSDAVKMLRPGTIYVVMRSRYLGKQLVGEITVSQFERDGWTRIDAAVATTFPNGEDWRWIAFKKDIPEGQVILTLASVQLPRDVPILFIFK